jgi:hypothetical protein
MDYTTLLPTAQGISHKVDFPMSIRNFARSQIRPSEFAGCRPQRQRCVALVSLGGKVQLGLIGTKPKNQIDDFI